MSENLKHFSVRELCCSSAYPKFVEVPKEGSTEYKNIVVLIQSLLDPIREKLGRPIIVTSGYRPKPLNDAVGGSSTSNHLFGYAADVHIKGNNVEIVEALLELGINFDECICEGAVFNKEGELVSCKWVHLALRPSNNRNKLLYTTNLKNYYKLKTGVKLSK